MSNPNVTKFKVGDMVVHRTQPELSWVVCQMQNDDLKCTRFAGDEHGLISATFFQWEVKPEEDDVDGLFKRLKTAISGMDEEGSWLDVWNEIDSAHRSYKAQTMEIDNG